MVNPDLLSCLAEATSQDPARLKAAEVQLEQWRSQPGYFRALFEVFQATDTNPTVRMLALIQLKNGVDKHWRRYAAHPVITTEDQAIIRAGLLHIVGHEVLPRETARLTADLIPLIARKDFSAVWSDPVERLYQLFTQAESSPEVQLQIMDTLSKTIKQLTSKTLGKDRLQFQNMAKQCFPVLLELYRTTLESVLPPQATPPLPVLVQRLHLARLVLRGLRQLVLHGLGYLIESPLTVPFMELTQGFLQHLYPLYQSMSVDAAPEVRQLVYRHLLLLAKIHYEMHEHHPAAFISAPPTITLLMGYRSVLRDYGLVLAQLNSVEAEATLPTKLLIRVLNLFGRIVSNPELTVRCRSYRSAGPNNRPDDSTLRDQLLTPAFLTELAEDLMTQYMLFRPLDLKLWSEEPEEWFTEEVNGQSEVSLRPCARNLFINLMNRFSNTLLPLIFQKLKATMATPISPNNIQTVDALYSAIGVSFRYLGNNIDYNNWITTKLVPDLREDGGPYSSILRWRTAWLIGELAEEDFPRSTTLVVYEALVHLTSPNQHLIVRLASLMALRGWMDTLKFSPHDFSPYLERLLGDIVQLLQTLEEPACQSRAIRCLAVISQCMDKAVAPAGAHFMNVLFQLWQECPELTLKNEIVASMIRLVTAMGPLSLDLQPLILQILQASIPPTAPHRLELQEDAMDLWLVTLRQSPVLTSDMLQAASFLEMNSEYSDETLAVHHLNILIQYASLDASALMQAHGTGVCRVTGNFIRENVDRSLPLISKLFGIIIQNAPPVLYQSPIIASGLFHHLLVFVMDPSGIRTHQTRGLEILTWLTIQDPEFVIQHIERRDFSPPDSSLVLPVDINLERFLSAWIALSDILYAARSRKRNVLGLIALFSHCRPAFGPLLSAMFRIWTSFLSEYSEDKRGFVPAYREVEVLEDECTEYTDDCDKYTARMSQISEKDIVLNVNTTDAIRSALASVEGQFQGGPAAFRQWLESNMSGGILADLANLIGMA
ncbi:hypothetical protein H4R33_003108 [Dimargaris cristalligena]|uniref:Armadillo-type protein n=1 Tax=Dimargaris cristalligena TaxID=215637 RepID=A0A4P9ZVK6_9FUNG|nr:hypothetical protein H4R33_003108 [Dimargaris cristalligena]RKP37627.1 armadillo-type protein [Dimargaris cristalligena]|eukprot:RKP37627.1 armadillo-type protein [Dimargaris cristalligena]